MNNQFHFWITNWFYWTRTKSSKSFLLKLRPAGKAVVWKAILKTVFMWSLWKRFFTYFLMGGCLTKVEKNVEKKNPNPTPPLLKPRCRWCLTSVTFSTASRTTLSVSLLWSAFILSLKSLKILVYLSWHMFWHTPSLLVWVLRCSIFGEEALNFLVWVETETFSMGWGIVGISWLELTASVSGSGSYGERTNLQIQVSTQNKLILDSPRRKKNYLTNSSTTNVKGVCWHGVDGPSGEAFLTSTGSSPEGSHTHHPHFPKSTINLNKKYHLPRSTMPDHWRPSGTSEGLLQVFPPAILPEETVWPQCLNFFGKLRAQQALLETLIFHLFHRTAARID